MPPRRLLLIPAVSALLAGCVVAPYPHRPVYSQPVPSIYNDPYDGGAVVEVAPPPPRVEVIPAIPFAGAVWIGGHWGWHRGRHHWNHGHWAHARPGHVWRPHGWVHRGGRWHERRGGWHRH